MALHKRYLQILTALLPTGVLGLSAALAPKAANATPLEGKTAGTGAVSDEASVAAELQAIRDAVDEARNEMQGGQSGQIIDDNIRLAWWANGNGLGWGNGGRVWGNGGHPAWANARPWGNGWGNGGWLNGRPWHNWHNGFWRN